MKSMFLLVILLALASALSHEYLMLAPLLAVFYGVAFFIQRSFDYGEDFFISFNARKDLKPSAKILLAGQEISTDLQADKQEDRFLNFFDTSRVVKRRVVGFLIPVCGYIFLHRQHQMTPGFNTIIPLICCYLIVNTFYVGHLYVILALNLLLALINIDEKSSIIVIISYAMCFMVCLGMLGQKGELVRRKVLPLLFMGSVYLALSWGLFQILQKPQLDLRSESLASPLTGEQQHQLQKFIGKQQSLSFSVEDALTRLQNMPQFSAEAGGLTQKLDRQKIKLDRLKQLAAKPQLSGEQFVELEGIIRDLEANQANIEATLNELSAKSRGKGSLSDEEFENLSSVLSSDPDRELTGGEKATVREYLKKKEEEAGVSAAYVERLKEYAAKAEQEDPLRALEAREMLDQVLEADQKLLHEKLGEALKNTEGLSMPALQSELKNEQAPERATDWWRRLKPLLLLAGIFLFLRFILKKKGVKKVASADPVILDELVEKWKQIRRWKLSPREEVIHFYHLFHESLQKIHYPKAETPPSCIVALNMQEFNPELTRATRAVTEIFAQCFYGNKEVTPEALKLFRRGLRRILTVYQLD